jgi:hypothetical protein
MMCAPCSSEPICGPKDTPPHRVSTFDVVFGAGQTADFFGDLVSQFAGRANHQRLTAEEARVDRVQQADTEGGGLAAAGLGLSDQVHAP